VANSIQFIAFLIVSKTRTLALRPKKSPIQLAPGLLPGSKAAGASS